MKRDRKEYPLVEATVDNILKPGQNIRTVWHNGKIYIHAVDLARAAGAEHDYEMLRDIKPEDTECRAKFQLTYDSLTEEEKQRTRNRSFSFLTTKGIHRRIQGTNLDNHQRDTLAKIAETAESIESIKHEIQREELVQQTINIPAVTPEELTAENKQLAAELDALAAETVAHELRNRGILEINRKTQRVYTVHSPHAPNRLAEIASYEIC